MSHPITEDSIYRPPKRPTHYECRVCRNERTRRYHAAQKAAS